MLFRSYVTVPKPTNGELTLRIINSLGQEVQNQNVPKGSELISINTSKIPEGVYFISMSTEKHVIYSEKLIIIK